MMTDIFPWQQGVLKLCKGAYAVLVLNYRRKILNMIFEIRLIFS